MLRIARRRHRPSGRRRAGPAGAAGVAAVVTAVAVVAWALRRISVQGDSMRPTLEPGDRVLVVRLPRWARLVPGVVVAVTDPRAPERLLVKRVAAVRTDGGVVVHGDNAAASTDSRTFGPVPRGSVWGIAWCRYAPPERAGRIRR